MTTYDLCFAWNWEYDLDFANLLSSACERRRLPLLHVTPDNLGGILVALENRQVSFRALLDRATDADPNFLPLARWAAEQGVYRINPYERALATWDKVAMHYHLIRAGLQTPHTIVIPSYKDKPILPPVNLQLLGDQFTAKPAHGGGGEGVVTEVTSLEQVLAARQEYASECFLLQAHILPIDLGGRPAWFRTIYCGGNVYPCWWHPESHIYMPVTEAEESKHGFATMRGIMARIAHLTGLDLFSAEIAFTADGLFVVIDYVNDPIDLRLQSKAADGVPDDIVRTIAECLAGLVTVHCKNRDTSLI